MSAATREMKDTYLSSIYLHKKRTFGVQLMSIVVLYHGRGGGVWGVGVWDRNPPVGSAALFCPCSDAPFFR